ncbi:hypothetical protein PMZ80_005340 [Knufia obscura]|uniref:Frequency clock protein n=2 Tax=Knufia TaxID=430999 RepID=A0AAN8ELG9_9EURO|nr:hypothetical protein PMZ80_005340 [Knufia obscura]KAK5958008.1 hypothetical protein OHC33_001198 [Knufia fluminis]
MNPRRTPINRLQDGRKRQKLSHNPEKASHAQSSHQIGDEVIRVLHSQDSGSSDQSAGKWFSQANKTGVPGQQKSAEPDDDPPFYMSDRVNYIPAAFAASEDRGFGGVSRLDSENEDLRGVIDDLTVENKRLRHMIRTRQRDRRDNPSNPTTQHEDKLFEVRIHGLPSEKRRELEALLKTFATSVHSTVPSLTTATSDTSSGQFSAKAVKPSAARTDSGYASASGTTSGATSKSASLGSASVQPSRDKAVKSYLQHIPDTLLPRQDPLMSERAKQTLVVRRLEQLFTGRVAGPGDHDQPMQQQEISQSAARADRLQDARDNKKGKVEGRREARIMPPDTKVNLDAMDPSDTKGTSTPKYSKEISTPGSPDQRPTRPLDLDIHRAQLGADNIQYMHHLGLLTPQFGGLSKGGEESPWMFLTLLTGLAQLHTLNVTPDFVRRAIRKFSKRFELSRDGLKLRWAGGSGNTRFAADDEKAIEVADINAQDSADDAGNGGSSKRSKTGSTSNLGLTSTTPSEDKGSGRQISSDSKQQPMTLSGTSNVQPSPNLINHTKPRSAFDYKPIVLREKQTGYDGCRDLDDSCETSSGDSSGLIQALSKSSMNQRSKDEGLITFYNNPHFCSDFSSEMQPSNMKPARPVVVGETLGVAMVDVPESPLRYHDATYFTSHFAPRPFDVESLSAEQRAKFDASLPKFPSLAPLSAAGEHETMPLELDACGLGGVTPEDNFALDVKVDMKPAPVRGQDRIVKQLPFSSRRYLQKFTTEVKSCQKLDLLPSKLPPPSYIFFASSSSSDTHIDDDSDDDSEGSSSPFVDEVFPAPPAFLQQFSGDSGEEHADGEDNDMESDIDMLATARRVNSAQIAEQERVYMLNQPGGIQRVTAGSLAATVGESRSASSTHEDGDVNSSGTEDGSRGESDEDDDADMGDA